MSDPISRQLVAYVDATTQTIEHPGRGAPDTEHHEETVMLDPRPTTRPGWPVRRKVVLATAAAFVLAAIGALAVLTRDSDEVPAGRSVSFELQAGEDTRTMSSTMGWAFADRPPAEIASPGPTLEVQAGDTVTVTVTNVHGWSQDPEWEFYESVAQSFRVIPPGDVGTVLWEADTGLIEPGETGSVTFTPTEPGEYRYVSTGLISGVDMFGRFVVTEAP